MKSLNLSRPSLPACRAAARMLVGALTALGLLFVVAQPASAQKKSEKSAAPNKGASKTASPSPESTPAATPSPSPADAATATGSPSPAATPADPEAQKRLKESREAIVAAYYPKAEAYLKAIGDFNAAGSISASTMKTKEDIAARRKLLDAANAANEDMIAFLKTEPDTLRVELGKVGMAPAKIDQYVADFTPDPKTDLMMQARLATKETFTGLGDALTFLDESFGRWKTAQNGHITFQKPADVKKYSAIVSKVQKAQAGENAALQKLQATEAAAGAASASPSVAATPGGAPAAGASATPGK